MAKRLQAAFKFKTTDSIGAAGAEDDEFLRDCFVDTGTLDILSDIRDRRLIILGRTGAGKSALLAMLEERQGAHVVRISAEHLALTYVANSTILNFFGSIGVNLDPFFKLLWRHVLTIEILQHHYGDSAASGTPSLAERLTTLFMGISKRDKEMRQAIAYLETWGKSFWLDTEYRVKEITSQVESQLQAQLKATLGGKAAAIDASASAADKITESERAELHRRGQDIISKAQVQDLHRVLKLLDAVLEDRQRSDYLVVDQLDENWVEERLRYKLIMALLQTAREFNEVRNAKVIVALRRDLIDRVFRLARDSGFQEEKYQSLYLPITWTKGQLLDVLDKRIGALVRRRYTKAPVVLKDVLPKQFKDLPIGDYIFSIAKRPRDVIAFFNTCIRAATDQPRLTSRDLKLAEGEYSRQRLRALADEWSSDYPRLVDFAKILQHRSSSFKLGTISDDQIANLCLAIALEEPSAIGLAQNAMQVVNCVMAASEFKLVLVRTFYHVGLVGIKRAHHEAESWVDELGRSVSVAEMNDDTSIVVNPAYRPALGVSGDR